MIYHDTTCDVCGRDQELNQCICPECPECGSRGDPVCYEHHGMKRSQEQIESRTKIESQWGDDAKAESKANMEARIAAAVAEEREACIDICKESIAVCEVACLTEPYAQAKNVFKALAFHSQILADAMEARGMVNHEAK